MEAYILIDKQPVPLDSDRAAEILAADAGWTLEENIRVAYTELRGGTYISTVFLGVDINSFKDESKLSPAFFETLLHRPNHENSVWHYSSWDEAEAGHWEVVKALWLGKPLPL